MAVKWNCDVCGKQTNVNPQVEVVKNEKGEVIYQKMEVQDNYGNIVSKDVPVVKDLEPRCHIIRLNAGQQAIQKDFCEECLEKVMPEVKALWEKLKIIGDK